MKTCEFEKYFVDYVSGELDKSEILQLQIHLEKCPTCPERLDQFYSTHQKILNRKRHYPGDSYLNNYHQSLEKIFSDTKEKENIFTKIWDIFDFLIHPRSVSFRLAEITALLLVGIIFGWLIFSPSNIQYNLDYSGQQIFSKPISKKEVEYIKYYFQAAELLLTEIKNVNQQGNINYSEITFQKEVAQKLLIKTFMVHEIALRQNDPRILKFLSKMEVILYEISNLDEKELVSSLPSFTVIIDDANLLGNAKAFQNQLIKFNRSISKENLNPGNLLQKNRLEKTE